MSFLIELKDPHRTLELWTIGGMASPSFTFSVALDIYGSTRVIREDEPVA